MWRPFVQDPDGRIIAMLSAFLLGAYIGFWIVG